jgi:hypothetical protein
MQIDRIDYVINQNDNRAINLRLITDFFLSS